MPSPRLSHDDQQALALDDLVRLGSQVDDLQIVITGPDQVSIHTDDNRARPARVIAYDAVGEGQAKQLVATQAPGHKIVVANRISQPARTYLATQGWSWLDRRIGAHLPIGRRDIEVRYTRPSDPIDSRARLRPSVPDGDGPIRGRAGLAYAAALLCSPREPPSFRSVAGAVDMSPTAISNAVTRLAAAGLVGAGNMPTLPDLFWALAEVWSPLRTVAVAAAPDPTHTEPDAQVDRLDQPGWVLGGDLAAVDLGAPLFSTERRPWLWVPTHTDLRRAERAYGPAGWSARAAVIAVPPTPLVCLGRRPPRAGGAGWPLPHPVFAALDLARDPGRGRQILSQWTPEGGDDVWH
jgi:hypothetical protein